MVQSKPLSDLIGKEFYRYKVVKYLGKRKHDKHWWECLCECGTSFQLNTSRITGNSPTRSCGCLRKETMSANRADPHKHGYSKTTLYAIYYGMLARCNNEKSQRYKYYGGRGISVCEEWSNDSLAFFDWAESHGYEHGLSIDRVDRNGNYCPENCEWVTVSENSRRMNEARRHESPSS